MLFICFIKFNSSSFLFQCVHHCPAISHDLGCYQNDFLFSNHALTAHHSSSLQYLISIAFGILTDNEHEPNEHVPQVW